MEIKLSEAMFDRVRARWEEYELELKD